jgi:hypothetical protein
MSAAVAGTTSRTPIRPTASYTTLRDVTAMTTTPPSHVALLAPGCARPAQASHSARYWPAAAIAIVALVGAIGWGAARTLDVISSPDDFARVSVPGSMVIPITASGKLVVYYEGTTRPPLGQLDFTVLDPAGRPVVVTAYGGDLRV